MSEVRLKKAALFKDELEFAFFAARLGWSIEEYESTTPIQRKFIRKELETYAVETSSLLENAVEVAVGNVLRKRGKKPMKLWKKKVGRNERAVSKREALAVKKAMAEKPPWTPWQKKGGEDGRLHP